MGENSTEETLFDDEEEIELGEGNWLIEIDIDKIPTPYKKYPISEILNEFVDNELKAAKILSIENWNLRTLAAGLRETIKKNGYDISVHKRKDSIFLKKNESPKGKKSSKRK